MQELDIRKHSLGFFPQGSPCKIFFPVVFAAQECVFWKLSPPLPPPNDPSLNLTCLTGCVLYRYRKTIFTRSEHYLFSRSEFWRNGDNEYANELFTFLENPCLAKILKIHLRIQPQSQGNFLMELDENLGKEIIKAKLWRLDIANQWLLHHLIHRSNR